MTHPRLYKIHKPAVNKNNPFYSAIFAFIIFVLFFTSFFIVNVPKIYGEQHFREIPSSRIDTVATSAMVIDYNTGEVYWEKNADYPMYPASTTKIITAILAIENIPDLDKKISISKNASGSNNSPITLHKGDEITLMDLLKMSLIASINNAAIALGEYVAGDNEKFIEMMNAKAKEIGTTNTNFENANGLDSNFPLHKSTARDLAKITSYSLKNELFKEIVSTKETTIHINKKEIVIENTNTLLREDFIKGVKTGYTDNAGFCLVAYSNKNNMELITVVLNSTPYGKNYDTLRLLNWVYDTFTVKKVVDSGKYVVHTMIKNASSSAEVDLYPEKDLEMLINKAGDSVFINYSIDENISLPLKEGKTYGILTVYVNGNKIKDINLVSGKKSDIP